MIKLQVMALMFFMILSCRVRQPSGRSDVKESAESASEESTSAWEALQVVNDRATFHYYGGEYCRNSKANSTHECKDFCGAFHPASLLSKVELLTIYGAYITWIPVAGQQQLINAMLYVLGNKSGISQPAAGAIGCAINFLSAISLEEMDQRHCRNTNYQSSCVMCDTASQALRAGCRIAPAIVTCAAQMGGVVPPPILALSLNCSAGTNAQKEILRYGCRNSCASSILAATPLAKAKEVEGRTVKRCCRCERKYFEDNYWPLSDNIFKTDYHWNPVSDTNAAVPECEGNENTYRQSEMLHNGYSVYYQYSSCKKVYVVGDVCPADNGMHEILK